MAKFSNDEMVARVNEIFEDDPETLISKAELLNPSPEFVQRLVYRFLMEFGYSDFMSQQHSCLDLHFGTSSNEIMETRNLDILVILTKDFFKRILSDRNLDITFGIMDIVQPDVKRVRKFLSIFVNFWLFCNSNYEMATQRQEEVMEKAKQSKHLIKEKNSNLKEIEDLRQKRETYEIHKMKLAEERAVADQELSEVAPKMNSLQETQKSLKKELQEQTKIKDELEQDVQKFEKEKERLEMLVKSDELKQELEKEISRLKEEKNLRISSVHELKVKMQDAKSRLVHFQKNLKELAAIEEKHKHIQKIQQNIELESEKKEEKSRSLQCLDEELAEDERKLNELQKECASRENNWKKKKTCLEAEIVDYENEIKRIRQGMSEEEIAASDLNLKITEVKQRIERIKSEIENSKQEVREEYQKLKESYMKFCENLKAEYKKMEDAFKKL